MDEYCADHGARQVALDALLSESEIISIHLPVTARTRLLFDAPLLDRTREGVILVNMARGGIVDEHALKLRLKSGRISAAAFDVFAQEPPADTELLNLPNMLATPHIGGSADEAVLAMGRAAIAGLFNAGDPLDHVPGWAA
ncbi:MAG: NAD(P)-dependent oxidoreductase [Rhizomicrobium sp.]